MKTSKNLFSASHIACTVIDVVSCRLTYVDLILYTGVLLGMYVPSMHPMIPGKPFIYKLVKLCTHTRYAYFFFLTLSNFLETCNFSSGDLGNFMTHYANWFKKFIILSAFLWNVDIDILNLFATSRIQVLLHAYLKYIIICIIYRVYYNAE